MKIIDRVAKLFTGRGYAEAAETSNPAHMDWDRSVITEDQDVWQNALGLTARSRDLFKTNPNFVSIRESFIANVFGAEGILLSSTVTETEDRYISDPEERRVVLAHYKKTDAVIEYYARKMGREHAPVELLREWKASQMRLLKVRTCRHHGKDGAHSCRSSGADRKEIARALGRARRHSD